MWINYNQMIHLPVTTESGKLLGHINDLEIETEAHCIRAYNLGQKSLFSKNNYRIAPTQIKTITATKIVVYDAILTELQMKQPDPAAATPPVFGNALPTSET